jgi:hypothetical protein
MDLRDDETFRCVTTDGRCWTCGGIVVLFIGYHVLLETDLTYAHVCQVRLYPGHGFYRECATRP